MRGKLLAVLVLCAALTGCAAGGPARMTAPAPKGRTAEAALTRPDRFAGFKPMEDWAFSPEPYLLTAEDSGGLFSLPLWGDDGDAALSPVQLLVKAQLTSYHWYGVPPLFPFAAVEDETGRLLEGRGARRNGELLVDEALAIETRYYTMAVGYDSPDGTVLIAQESNYPQFCAAALPEYRWYWLGEDGDGAPRQPEPYRGPIRIQAAELNWIFIDEIITDGTPAPGDGDGSLSMEAYTQLQNEWLTERGAEERAWCQAHGYGPEHYHYELPEEERCCAATGLTILNGDSRTEETFFSGSRAKDIRITVGGTYTKEVTLADSPAPQMISLDYTQPTIAEPLDITVEVLSSYPGRTPEIYITEIGVGIDSDLPQGR